MRPTDIEQPKLLIEWWSSTRRRKTEEVIVCLTGLSYGCLECKVSSHLANGKYHRRHGCFVNHSQRYKFLHTLLQLLQWCLYKKATLVLLKFKFLPSNTKLRNVTNSFVWKYHKLCLIVMRSMWYLLSWDIQWNAAGQACFFSLPTFSSDSLSPRRLAIYPL